MMMWDFSAFSKKIETDSYHILKHSDSKHTMSEQQSKTKDQRIEEFMEWQMDLFKQLKEGRITHAQGMRMMRDLYPEFTPDDKEGEDSFTDKTMTVTEAEKVALERSKRFNSDEPVPGAKSGGGRNSDSKEFFGVACPCGWTFRKQDQAKATDRALRLHTKVCKVAQAVDKNACERHSIITGKGGILSSSRTE